MIYITTCMKMQRRPAHPLGDRRLVPALEAISFARLDRLAFGHRRYSELLPGTLSFLCVAESEFEISVVYRRRCLMNSAFSSLDLM
jgi:hypothetical protein